MVTIPNINNVCDITKNTQQLCQNRHKHHILAQGQSIFYLYKASMMDDYGTQHEQNPQIPQHEQNPLIHLRYVTTNIKKL